VTDAAAPFTQHVFCSNSAAAYATGSTFHTANGTWAPPALQNVGATINQLRSKACRAGYTATIEHNDAYTFGAYSRAETIEGTNNFSVAENRLADGSGNWGSTNTAAAGGVDRSVAASNNNFSYVSWTATDVYFGFQGDALTSSTNEYLSFYLLGGSGGTGLPAAGVTGTPTVDTRIPSGGSAFEFDAAGAVNATNFNYHFFIRPADGISSAKVRVWNGTAWIDPATSIDLSATNVALGGTLGNVNAYVEFHVSRAALGLSAANSHLMLQGLVWDQNGTGTATASVARFPAASAAEKPTAGTTNRWKYFDGDMSSALFPSNRAYIKP